MGSGAVAKIYVRPRGVFGVDVQQFLYHLQPGFTHYFNHAPHWCSLEVFEPYSTTLTLNEGSQLFSASRFRVLPSRNRVLSCCVWFPVSYVVCVFELSRPIYFRQCCISLLIIITVSGSTIMMMLWQSHIQLVTFTISRGQCQPNVCVVPCRWIFCRRFPYI